MTMITLAVALVAAAGVLLAIRLILGPTVGDRVVGIDALLVIVIGALAVLAGDNGRSLFVDVALVISLLAFVGTCIAARFVEQRGT